MNGITVITATWPQRKPSDTCQWNVVGHVGVKGFESVSSVVSRYHGGQDGQEERCRGDVTGTLGEGGDEEAQDDGDGPGGDGVERRHLRTHPTGETGLLSDDTHTHTRHRPAGSGHRDGAWGLTHTSLPLASAKPPPSSSMMFQGIFF